MQETKAGEEDALKALEVMDGYHLHVNSSKARKELKWKPSVDFSGLVKIMVEHDINEAKKDLALLKDNLISPTWEYPKI